MNKTFKEIAEAIYYSTYVDAAGQTMVGEVCREMLISSLQRTFKTRKDFDPKMFERIARKGNGEIIF